MNRSVASSLTLAFLIGLAPASGSFGQTSPADPTRRGPRDQADLFAWMTTGDAQDVQGNGPAKPPNEVPFRVLNLNNAIDLNITWAKVAGRNSGMTLDPADPAVREQLRLAKGLIVSAVEPGSPAAAAGIRQNDVLFRIGNDPQRLANLGTTEELEAGLKAAGDQPVTLWLLRDGKEQQLKVQPHVGVSLGPVPPDPPAYWIGASVAPVEPALRAQLRLPGKQGLIVTEVVQNGPAAKAGIRPHDILLKLDGADLTDQVGLNRLVQSRGERAFVLELLRTGRKQEVKIAPERRSNLTYFLPDLTTNSFNQFAVVLPGAVVPDQRSSLGFLYSPYAPDNPVPPPTEMNRGIGGPGDPNLRGPSTEQRLDELTAQIKELRQAVEALAKSREKK